MNSKKGFSQVVTDYVVSIVRPLGNVEYVLTALPERGPHPELGYYSITETLMAGPGRPQGKPKELLTDVEYRYDRYADLLGALTRTASARQAQMDVLADPAGTIKQMYCKKCKTWTLARAGKSLTCKRVNGHVRVKMVCRGCKRPVVKDVGKYSKTFGFH